ncbi:forespore capture DNA-binding protein RefZ [Aquibacillus koreensis]|uniref:Forespore capture DNA-binding protein RefZ n=1 Tax=Aquibacillus koreensis TaxID=279446 RepID=A0A9X3WL45_9BACI|nr:forespore capture DNA-binding protein RefZ [Aquibacillus koreensis]MCT2534997.1 forespore capture DNA-binding protein RefZ [Aquibacillus koreensis]MDC3419284.1 forespore capture DNA-binding protein RefZ [Aquibacillus koreensis]
MKKNETKQKVMDAACTLFYNKGYHGTSVRDIAKKASVNVSLINYYFSSKQGLLESAVITYYEEYLIQIEQSLAETESLQAMVRLKKMIEAIIQYKQKRHQFTCFIQRELTIDSIFVREMMVTYLAKENYLISKLFNAALEGTSHSTIDREFLLLQLKGMLCTPYIAPRQWKNQIVWDQSHDLFISKYTKSINKWLDYVGETYKQEVTDNGSTKKQK